MPKQIYSTIQYNETMQYYKICDTCRPIKTNIDVDRISYDKFDKLITDLYQWVATNKQVLNTLEGERSSTTYFIQTMSSDWVKLKVKSDNVIEVEINNDIIRIER